MIFQKQEFSGLWLDHLGYEDVVLFLEEIKEMFICFVAIAGIRKEGFEAILPGSENFWCSRKLVFGNTGNITAKDNMEGGPISGMGWTSMEFHEHNSTREDNQKCWVMMWVVGLEMGTVGGVDLLKHGQVIVHPLTGFIY